MTLDQAQHEMLATWGPREWPRGGGAVHGSTSLLHSRSHARAARRARRLRAGTPPMRGAGRRRGAWPRLDGVRLLGGHRAPGRATFLRTVSSSRWNPT